MRHYKGRRTLSILLALVMVFGILFAGTGSALATGNEGGKNLNVLLTPEQLEAYKLIDRSTRPSGLIGFTDEYELAGDDDGNVSIIVEFVHQPPLIEQAEADIRGRASLSLREATVRAESDHTKFRSELNALFGHNPNARTSAPAPFEITSEYFDAINGVTVRVPANKVAEIAEMDMVWAVYPNARVQVDPVPETADYNSEAAGMLASREMLGINDLHKEGLTGKGIRVGVMDTGVDYNHPDLQGAFSTTPISDIRPINNTYYGRNFVDRFNHDLSPYNIVFADRVNYAYDPMETTYKEWTAANQNNVLTRLGLTYADYCTGHGTHVSGTIAARGESDSSAVGMAPDATLLVYRVLGPTGSGWTEWVVQALDKVYEDGCDVVNMSMGVNLNDPTFVTSVAVNNLILSHDIVFAISAGNQGPAASTLGSPGTSSLAITVANGAMPETRVTMDIAAAGYTAAAPMTQIVDDAGATKIIYNDYGFWKECKILMPGEDPGDWTNSGYYPIVFLRNSLPDEQSEGCAIINVYEKDGMPGERTFFLGTGLRAEFEEQKAQIPGSIVLVNRGQVFLDTARLAKEYGARAVLVLNYTDGWGPNGQVPKPGFQGSGEQYAPLFFINNDYPVGGLLIGEGWSNINYRMSNYYTEWGEVWDPKNNELKINFDNYLAADLPVGVYSDEGGSSRGPVAGTLDIKPDIVAPGHIITSCVPYFLSSGNQNNDTGPDRYDNAYAGYSGTSMSSPHIAGIAALMRQYSRENAPGEHGSGWSAMEIKARMMNTADPLEGAYSVHEMGAGFVSPKAAIFADTYITVDYDDVYLPSPNNPYFISPERGKAEMASFNFRSLKLGQEEEQRVELTSTVRNAGNTAKTFAVSYVKNYVGFKNSGQQHMVATEQKWKDAGIAIEFSTQTVTVGAGGSAEFTAGIVAPPDVKDSGFYEGYVVLTNTSDTGEVYRLPFSLYMRAEAEVNQMFLTHPVITTAGLKLGYDPTYGLYVGWDPEIVHAEDSFYSTLYFDLGEEAYALYLYVAPGDIDNIYDESQYIGEMAAELNLSGTVPGYMYKEFVFVDPLYLHYTNEAHTEADLALFAPGHYKMIAYIISPFGTTYYPMDFYVDNDAPAFTIDGLVGNTYTYAGPSRQETVLTGNIYDEGLAYLAENNIQYQIYEPNDPHGPDADQALNAIFAQVAGSGKWVRGEIRPNGDYTLSLTGLNLSGTTQVEVYYYDHFAIADYEGITGWAMEWEFDPNTCCLTRDFGYPFAFFGANEGKKTITVRHKGPALSLNRQMATVNKGTTLQLGATLNDEARAAGYKQAIEWSSLDERVATVDQNGLVTAVDWGTASIQAKTKSLIPGGGEIVATCRVTVPGRGDGVPSFENTQLWFGTYEYEDYNMGWGTSPENPYFQKSSWPFQTYDEYWNYYQRVPMLWDYKGEETQNGVGDRMITLYSSYAVETMDYNDNGWVPYEDSNVNKFLNGAFLDKAFSAGEQGAIPSYTVTNGVYDKDGNLVDEYEIPNQRAYLPWGIPANAKNQFANSVFWTAGNERQFDFSQKGASNWKNHKRARNIGELLWMTYYLRNPSAVKDNVLVAKGYEGDVRSTDDWSHYGVTLNWIEYGGGFNYTEAEAGVAVAPVIKLDKESILWAHRIDDSNATGMLYFKIDESPMYKLTVVGGNNGGDIGTINGISTEPRTVTGNTLTLSGLSAQRKSSGADLIAVKVVGDNANGERVNLGYNTYNATSTSLNIDLSGSATDQYMVYVYLLDRHRFNITSSRLFDGFGSYESGVVYEIPVTRVAANAVDYTVEYRADGVDGELLYSYAGNAASGATVTADSLGFAGFVEAPGQNRNMVVGGGSNTLVIVYDREYVVEYRVDRADGLLLHAYSAGAALGKTITAETLAFSGYTAVPGQAKTLVIGTAENTLVVIYSNVAAFTATSDNPLIEEIPGIIKLMATGENLEDIELTAYLKVGGELLYETALAGGSAAMSIARLPAAGTYEVVLYIDGKPSAWSAAVTVAPKATEVVINAPISVTVKKGKTLQLDVSSNAAQLVYMSSNTSIATVSQTGVVAGVKTGMTIVTVYAADNSQKFAYIVVNVIA